MPRTIPEELISLEKQLDAAIKTTWDIHTSPQDKIKELSKAINSYYTLIKSFNLKLKPPNEDPDLIPRIRNLVIKAEQLNELYENRVNPEDATARLSILQQRRQEEMKDRENPGPPTAEQIQQWEADLKKQQQSTALPEGIRDTPPTDYNEVSIEQRAADYEQLNKKLLFMENAILRSDVPSWQIQTHPLMEFHNQVKAAAINYYESEYIGGYPSKEATDEFVGKLADSMSSHREFLLTTTCKPLTQWLVRIFPSLGKIFLPDIQKDVEKFVSTVQPTVFFKDRLSEAVKSDEKVEQPDDSLQGPSSSGSQ